MTLVLRTAATAIVALLVVATCHAQPLPSLTQPVNDFANVIDAADEAEMDRRIRSLDAATKDAVVVVTVESLATYGTVEEYAVKLFESARIGRRGLDNGALIVLAVRDRKVRIEVGYGLEEFLPDGYAGETIRQTMLPAFRDGAYGRGLLDGTTRVINRIAERRGVTLQDVPQERPTPEAEINISPFAMFVAFMILMAIMNSINRRSGGSLGRRGRRSSTWSGWTGGPGSFGGGFGGFGGGFGGGRGGGGGSFGGFGGGRSGGGGASGGW